jgi:hypothetical protein
MKYRHVKNWCFFCGYVFSIVTFHISVRLLSLQHEQEFWEELSMPAFPLLKQFLPFGLTYSPYLLQDCTLGIKSDMTAAHQGGRSLWQATAGGRTRNPVLVNYLRGLDIYLCNSRSKVLS